MSERGSREEEVKFSWKWSTVCKQHKIDSSSLLSLLSVSRSSYLLCLHSGYIDTLATWVGCSIAMINLPVTINIARIRFHGTSSTAKKFTCSQNFSILQYFIQWSHMWGHITRNSTTSVLSSPDPPLSHACTVPRVWERDYALSCFSSYVLLLHQRCKLHGWYFSIYHPWWTNHIPIIIALLQTV